MKKFKAMRRLNKEHGLALDITQVKNFLKIEHNTDDDLIKTMINAAVEVCENYTGLALINQEWLIQFSDIATYKIELPIRPIENIKQVEIRYHDGSKMKYGLEHYSLDQNCLLLHVTPIAAQIDIICKCGYGSSFAAIPAHLGSILLEHVAHLYESRGTKVSFDMKRYDPFKKLKI
ncbi:head-tail connector protein [Candidatus Jidaibacter acanthamoebae]|uniref:head-tail connector protein n=1 Tax=Candidatus Jidaibacter acanthamoebae TaxID=86105 RepID=UPI00057D9262|nr:head-tail connector protein [Candidatus Jidaibacter acanthamoeba]